jgi:CO dehydrogenase/acetyl-CoA synthase beta subunit
MSGKYTMTSKIDLVTVDERVHEFNNLLEGIDNLDDKKKALWKEIYENAVTDRQNAYLVYTELLKKVLGNAAEHAIHGATIAKYLERMSKSNDQIIKLAELIAAEQEKAEKINKDDLYTAMNS